MFDHADIVDGEKEEGAWIFRPFSETEPAGPLTSWDVYQAGGLVQCLTNQSMVLGSSTTAPGNLLEMQNLGLHLRPAEVQLH